MTQIADVIGLIARSHYFAIGGRPGDACQTFIGALVEGVPLGAVNRAFEAATYCEAVSISGKTDLQTKMLNELERAYLSATKPHPLGKRKAECFAETLLPFFDAVAEQRALALADASVRQSDSSRVHSASLEREAEIERNRRRPPRRPLYPV